MTLILRQVFSSFNDNLDNLNNFFDLRSFTGRNLDPADGRCRRRQNVVLVVIVVVNLNYSMQLCTKKVDTTSDPTATMNFRMFPIVILLIFIIVIKF